MAQKTSQNSTSDCCLMEFKILSIFNVLYVHGVNTDFSTVPKKLKDEKTQNSKKKLKTQGKDSKLKEKFQNSSKTLKDSTNFGVNYSKNQRK